MPSGETPDQGRHPTVSHLEMLPAISNSKMAAAWRNGIDVHAVGATVRHALQVLQDVSLNLTIEAKMLWWRM